MKVSPSCNAISFRFLTLAIKPNDSEFQFLKMNLAKFAALWEKKSKKTVFFLHSISLKIIQEKEKERKNRK